MILCQMTKDACSGNLEGSYARFAAIAAMQDSVRTGKMTEQTAHRTWCDLMKQSAPASNLTTELATPTAEQQLNTAPAAVSRTAEQA